MTARDVAASARVGDRMLWVFGDTLFNRKSEDGTSLRSSTAAWANPDAPLEVSEPTDANGAPRQFVPFTAEEAAFNASTGTPQDRIALWPGAPIADGDSSALIWCSKTRIRPGFLNYEHLGVGLARLAAGATTGSREGGLLFGLGEPMLVNAARFGEDVYLYGNRTHGSGGQLVVARAPFARVADRGAYRFHDGGDWTPDASRAATLFAGVPGELSVSRNAHLGAYLAVYADVLAGRVVARTAARPEGPWSPPAPLFEMRRAKTEGFSYAAREHPDLATDGGRTLFVTYYQPLGAFSGTVRAVRVTLR